MSKPEKRNYQRIDVDINAELNIEGKRLSASISNISCGGLFLPIQKDALKERTDIEVILSLPDQKKPVKVVGEVSRVQEASMIKRRPEGVAIQFRGLYDDNILAIDRFIKNKVH